MVVPLDRLAEANALRVQGFMTEALQAFTQWSARKPDELFGLPEDPDSHLAHKRAEGAFVAGQKAFDAKKYDVAERSLKSALTDFAKGAASIKDMGHLCEATALYAATVFHRGDVEEAKVQLLDLLALGPTHELSGRRYPQGFIQLRAAVAQGTEASLRGSAALKTKPAGARVYVDGEFQGFAPLSLPTLSAGKHLLRVEHPGFRPYGQLVEISPELQELVIKLVASAGYRSMETLFTRAASELGLPTGTAFATLGRDLGLSHGVLGVLRETEDARSELTLAYYDVQTGKRLGTRKMTFQGDEYGQLQTEVVRAVTALVNGTDPAAQTAKSGADPLVNKHGTEDWSAEDKGGHVQRADKKRSKTDPLEHKDGTEDW